MDVSSSLWLQNPGEALAPCEKLGSAAPVPGCHAIWLQPKAALVGLNLPPEALHSVLADWPGPVSLFSDLPPGCLAPSIMAEGAKAAAGAQAEGFLPLAGWWPLAWWQDERARAACLSRDQQRWQAACRQAEALAQAEREFKLARQQLDERKWVDRAKGVLMNAQTGPQSLGEEEAFRLLRSAAMQTGLRMGQVSRSVVESAGWADAINRAGQLRMLSQRLVKLAAQRLAGVDSRRARTLQFQAGQRAQDNLDHLKAHLPGLVPAEATGPLTSALNATLSAWAELKTALDERQTPQMLARSDACAEALLDAAETLTSLLEQLGGRPSLRVVNLCGRQRMRVQRLAKSALLADLLQEPSRHDTLVAMLDEFEAALQELERVPLTSGDIRKHLEAAREEWLRLLRGLRHTTGAGFGSSPGSFSTDRQAALAGSADLLLDLFDRLTAAYEHSLQVIMG